MGVRASVTADGTSGTHVACTSAVTGRLHRLRVRHQQRHAAGRDRGPVGIQRRPQRDARARPDFYGLALDSNSSAEIMVAAAWAERPTAPLRLAVGGLRVQRPRDHHGRDDLLKAASYGYSTCWFYLSIGTAAGWLAGHFRNRLLVDSGATPWAFKTPRSIAELPTTTPQRAVSWSRTARLQRRTASPSLPGQGGPGWWVDVVRPDNAPGCRRRSSRSRPRTARCLHRRGHPPRGCGHLRRALRRRRRRAYAADPQAHRHRAARPRRCRAPTGRARTS